jgi:hypothetical protein
MRTTGRMWALGYAAAFAALGIRLATADYAMWCTCAVFWVLFVFFDVATGWWLMIPGVLCNAIAMLSNGGRMPVFGSFHEGTVTGWHVAASVDTKLSFLCDYDFLYWASVGDILMVGSGVVYFGLWFARQCSRRDFG